LYAPDAAPSQVPAAASHALVDGHVHLHDGFDVPAFLDAAAANLAAVAKHLRLPDDTIGCLLLVECRGVDYFARIADGTVSTGAWRVSRTDEPVSLLLRRPGALPTVLVAGRQIVCREGLEVLALATRAEFEDGMPLVDVVRAVRAAGALVVVPWGFGKWWFGRRQVLDDLLGSAQPGDIFLGDNGNRARLAPPPAAFRTAARRRLWILPGSDPLPLPWEVARAGRNGFMLQGLVSAAHPARDLVHLIRKQSASPQIFGRGEALPSFVRNQIAMQLRKRRPSGSPRLGL
jgi:hypothetical protein